MRNTAEYLSTFIIDENNPDNISLFSTCSESLIHILQLIQDENFKYKITGNELIISLITYHYILKKAWECSRKVKQINFLSKI